MGPFTFVTSSYQKLEAKPRYFRDLRFFSENRFLAPTFDRNMLNVNVETTPIFDFP
jgi:hypothetical protein